MKSYQLPGATAIILLLMVTICFGKSALADDDFIQTAEQAWPMIQKGVLLVDVRTAEEFAAGHLNGAINIPYDQTDDLMAAIGNDKQREVVFYCRTGNRVGKAMVVLKTKGYTGIFNAKSFAALKETKP